jgi:hypothetical protein
MAAIANAKAERTNASRSWRTINAPNTESPRCQHLSATPTRPADPEGQRRRHRLDRGVAQRGRELIVDHQPMSTARRVRAGYFASESDDPGALPDSPLALRRSIRVPVLDRPLAHDLTWGTRENLDSPNHATLVEGVAGWVSVGGHSPDQAGVSQSRSASGTVTTIVARFSSALLPTRLAQGSRLRYHGGLPAGTSRSGISARSPGCQVVPE